MPFLKTLFVHSSSEDQAWKHHASPELDEVFTYTYSTQSTLPSYLAKDIQPTEVDRHQALDLTQSSTEAISESCVLDLSVKYEHPNVPSDDHKKDTSKRTTSIM